AAGPGLGAVQVDAHLRGAADLLDRGRDDDELPGDAAKLRVEQRVLEPGELRRPQHRAVGAVRLGLVAGAEPHAAVRAVVHDDEDRVRAPLLRVVEAVGNGAPWRGAAGARAPRLVFRRRPPAGGASGGGGSRRLGVWFTKACWPSATGGPPW